MYVPGLRKSLFQIIPHRPQIKKKGVVPVLRSVQNRYNTLFLSGEGFGTYKKGLLRSPDVQLLLTTPLPPSPRG